MLRILSCIGQEHDSRLLVLAALVCLVGCYTTASVTERASTAAGRLRLAWGAGAAVAFGASVWTTHFVAMLAYQPGLHASFGLSQTALSLAVAIGASLFAFALLLAAPGRPGAAAAGLLLGAGISGMHYLGMAAVTVPGIVVHDPALVGLSLAMGTGFAIAAMLWDGAWRLPLRAGLLALAITGLHFTAMAAATILPLAGLPDPAGAAGGTPASTGLLAVAVASVGLLILLPNLGGALLDKHLHRRTMAESERLRSFAASTFEGILFHRDGLVTDTNPAMCRMLGRPAERVIGRRVESLFVPGTFDQLAPEAELEEASEAQLLDGGGRERPVELLGRRMEQQGRPTRVMVVRDLTERRSAERQIAHLVHYDVLTGLANRLLLGDRMRQALAAAEHGGAGLAVLCIDLDRFKAVNDLMGHAAGDQVLAETARRLAASVREGDTVARLGGDEFAVVLPRAGDAEAAQLAGRLVAQLAAPFEVDGRQVGIGGSVGISIWPHDGRTAEALLRNADLAQYRAKQEGRGTWRYFEQEMDRRLQERRKMEQDLRGAVAAGELFLEYQPLCDSISLGIVGYEALLRWNHPVRGVISPAEFVPLAEESGLISPIGAWVLETACAEAAGWEGGYRVAVNISPAQFAQGDLVALVAGVLARTGLDPRRLELEVTEGVLISDTDRALATLTGLRAQNIRLALDDFGTGYSSLNYLRRFPFDKIKIDRSFVQGLGLDANADAIVGSIMALARGLGLMVTAEGVETHEQLAQLRRQDCGQVQGFLLGRPAGTGALAHAALPREVA